MSPPIVPATQAAVEYAALAVQRATAAFGRQVTKIGDFAAEHRIIVVSVLVGLVILFVLRPRSRRR